MVLSVSYLGSFGRELPDFVDTNLNPSSSTVTYTVIPVDHSNQQRTRLRSSLLGQTRIRRHDQDLQCRQLQVQRLTIQFNRRMGRSLQFNANYTWSHSLDFGQNESTFTDTNDLLEPSNLKKEYGNSNFNVPNRFVFSAVAESPWKTKRLDKLPRERLGKIAPIYQAQNGLPFSLVTTGNAPGGVSSGANGSNGRKGIDIIVATPSTFQEPRSSTCGSPRNLPSPKSTR